MFEIRTKYLKGSVTASKFIRKGDEVIFFHNREIVATVPEPVEIAEYVKEDKKFYRFHILENGKKISESLEVVHCDNIQAINLERILEKQYRTATFPRVIKCIAHREYFADMILTIEELDELNWK